MFKKKTSTDEAIHVPVEKKPLNARQKRVLICFGAVIMCIVFIITGLIVKRIYRTKYVNTENEYGKILNEVELYKDKAQKVEYSVTESPDVKLDSFTWADDDRIICDYILDAFTYRGITEYTEHRAKYVEELGDDNTFVENVIPEITIDPKEYLNEYELDEDLASSHFSSIKEKGFSSIVLSADDKTRTYIAFVTVSSARLDKENKSMRDRCYVVKYTFESEAHPDGWEDMHDSERAEWRKTTGKPVLKDITASEVYSTTSYI